MRECTRWKRDDSVGGVYHTVSCTYIRTYVCTTAASKPTASYPQALKYVRMYVCMYVHTLHKYSVYSPEFEIGDAGGWEAPPSDTLTL